MAFAENIARPVTRRTFLAVAGALAGAACMESTTPEPSTPPKATFPAATPPKSGILTETFTGNELRQAAREIIEEANTINRKFENYPATQNRGPILEETRLYLLKKYRFYYNPRLALGGIDPTNGSTKLTLSSKEFDLSPGSNPGTVNKFTFVSALLDEAILGRYPGLQPTSGSRPTPTAMGDIGELEDRLEFHDASRYPFLSARIVQELAWRIGFLKQTRLAIPTQVFLGGHYDPSGRGNLGDQAMELDRYQDPAPALANFYMSKQPDIFRNFTDSRNRILASVKGGIRQPELTFAYFTSRDDDNSAFTLAFSRYISDGVGFRRRILYAKTKGLIPEAEVLQAQYNSLMGAMGVENSAGPFLKGIQSVRMGEEYSVYDFLAEKNPGFRGIYLRPEPRPDIDPKWASVERGDTVVVLAGPAVTISDTRKEGYEMYKVEAVKSWRDNSERRGWIDKEYLQQLIPPQPRGNGA